MITPQFLKWINLRQAIAIYITFAVVFTIARLAGMSWWWAIACAYAFETGAAIISSRRDAKTKYQKGG